MHAVFVHMSCTCISVYRHISSPEFLELDVIALKGSEASHCKCSVLACEKYKLLTIASFLIFLIKNENCIASEQLQTSNLLVSCHLEKQNTLRLLHMAIV